VAFFQKIGRMLQEDFSPPFDGFFFLKLLFYLAFFVFCFRVFGSSGCNAQPEGRIIQGPDHKQLQEVQYQAFPVTAIGAHRI